MPVSQVGSYTLCGLAAIPVTVEVSIDQGLPGLHIVGLPDKAVEESRERVRAALKHLGFGLPAKRITVNLAPADLKKEGSHFDLPIALGILAADQRLPKEAISQYRFISELGLGGELRPTRGFYIYAHQAHHDGVKLVCATAQSQEASLCAGDHLYLASTIDTLVAALIGQTTLDKPPSPPAATIASESPPFLTIAGQTEAKEALIIAAAGGHHLRLIGPPGTGKTLLARTLIKLLPPLTKSEEQEVLMISSLAAPLNSQPQLVASRPFRAPHHTSSPIAIVGGGHPIQPGEITLAHRGVLFLDELPEFPRGVLEVLREPLEERRIHLARASQRLTFPTAFQLVAAHNPCPCGYWNDSQQSCTCLPGVRERYSGKLSGPLLDRLDLSVTLYRMPSRDLIASSNDNHDPRPVISAARLRQLHRQGKLNAELDHSATRQLEVSLAGSSLLTSAGDKLQLSGRALHRLLRISRTIADLEVSPSIEKAHILRALAFRQ